MTSLAMSNKSRESAYNGSILHKRAHVAQRSGVNKHRDAKTPRNASGVAPEAACTRGQTLATVRHCAIVGDGCAGPPKPSILSDQACASARSASLTRWKRHPWASSTIKISEAPAPTALLTAEPIGFPSY